nr:nucleoside 2-deoxyribosyltransferase [Methylosinus sp. R-45379]
MSDSRRRRVFAANIARIENSDFVFAHINEVDCFGTLFELGHAHAAGIPTFIHFGEDLTDRQKSELWFARMGCIPILGSIEDAFDRALDIWRAACATNTI